MNAGNEKRLTSVGLPMLKPWDLMMVDNAVWILRALWLVKKKSFVLSQNKTQEIVFYCSARKSYIYVYMKWLWISASVQIPGAFQDSIRNEYASLFSVIYKFEKQPFKTSSQTWCHFLFIFNHRNDHKMTLFSSLPSHNAPSLSHVTWFCNGSHTSR